VLVEGGEGGVGQSKRKSGFLVKGFVRIVIGLVSGIHLSDTPKARFWTRRRRGFSPSEECFARRRSVRIELERGMTPIDAGDVKK